jgi:hypothetical protein
MADLTKIINIKIDFGKGNITVDKLTTSIKDLDKASKNLSDTFVKKVKPAFDNTESSILSQISNLKKQRAEVAQTAIQYGQFSDRIAVLQNELAHLQGKTSNAASGFNNMRNSSGLASQTLVEVGRTISDANYGFTAVANNLSQLGYYFVTLTKEAGGFRNSMKDLGKQLLGAGGLIIAFQLVIFFIEKYTLSQREAKRATEETRNALVGAKGQIAAIESYANVLKDSTASTESQKVALEKLKKEGFDKTIGSIDEYLAIKKELLLFEATEEVTKKKLQKVIEKDIELNEELTTATEEYLAKLAEVEDLESRGQKSYVNKEKLNKNYTKTWTALTKAIGENNDSFKDVTTDSEKRLKEIADRFKDNPFFCLLLGTCKEDKNKGASAKNVDDFFKQRLLNLRKLELKYLNDSLIDERTTAEERLKINKDAAVLDLKRRRDDFLEKERLRFAEFRAEKEAIINNSKSTKKQIEQAEKELGDGRTKFYASSAAARKEYNDVLLAIDASFNNKSLQLERQKNLAFEQLLNENQVAELASVAALATNDLNRIDANFALEQEKAAQKIALIEQEKEIRLKAGQDTFIQDQQIANETEALNQKRLQAFEQGEQAKLAIANQVGEAIIAIAGEGSAVGKAVAVAMATMNTYEAVTAALGSKPYGPWNIAQAAAVAAMGFVQVRNILKTEVPSPKGGAGGGAAAAPSIQPPDFNIVGQSASNQLASAVQGQFNQPVKAYVVSKDVSTAQEMDRNIVSTASLG